MCDVVSALIGVSTVLDAYGQRQESRAQAEQYKAQAAAAQQNARMKEGEASRIADDYASKQRRINDRLRLARGQALASAGASGINGAGSVLDNLSAIDMGAEADSQDLLHQQREQTWAKYVEQVNYNNQANSYRNAARNVKRQGDMAALGTLIGGAASIYGGLGSGGGSSGGGGILTKNKNPFSVGDFRRLNDGAW